MIYIAGPGHGGPAVGREHLPGRVVSELYPNISQDEIGLKRLFKQFSFPGGISSHVAADDAGLHSRGRRARLLAQPRLRRRVRQSGAGRGLHHRRRRGRDRAIGHGVAVQQVARPRDRRSRAADSSPQRLQNQQPDHSGADRARGAGAVSSWLRVDAVFRRRSRSGAHAPAHGGDPRPRPSRTFGASRTTRARRATRLGPDGP